MVAEILRPVDERVADSRGALADRDRAAEFSAQPAATLTSLQDQSLTTVPRLVAVALILLVGMPWFLGRMAAYTRFLLTDLHRYIG